MQGDGGRYAHFLIRPHVCDGQLPWLLKFVKGHFGTDDVQVVRVVHANRYEALQLVEAEYAEHRGKPFFGPLVHSMTYECGVVGTIRVVRVRVPERFGEPWAAVRDLCGDSDPEAAAEGTIRRRFFHRGRERRYNVVHSPDSAEAAAAFKARWVQ